MRLRHGLRSLVQEVDEQTRARYRRRLKLHGPSEHWRIVASESPTFQEDRFRVLVQMAQLSGKSIIDVGCGLGDLVKFLDSRGIRPRSYLGIDVVPELVAIAQEENPRYRFMVGNPLLQVFREKADVVSVIGVSNHRLKRINNYEYSKLLIQVCFEMAKELVMINMLSSYLTPKHRPDFQYFHYSPEQMFNICHQITPYVSLHHDFEPLPHNELFITLRRVPVGLARVTSEVE